MGVPSKVEALLGQWAAVVVLPAGADLGTGGYPLGDAGVWEKLHQVLLDKLGDAGKIDWSRAAVDSASVAAKKGANVPAPIRRIKENRARSASVATLLWSTPKEFRSR